MARITNEQAEKMSSGNSEWFQLKNDGDVAKVQFMLNTIDDIPMFSAHKVKINDKDRYVDCLRQDGDPIDVCPFCAAGIPAKPVRFVVMFQHDDEKVKIWERGRQFISKLQGLINRYSPLEKYVFEIERHGRAGDTSTKYEIYPIDSAEPFDLTDVEIPDFEGGIILQKSADDMETYLNTGSFPVDNSSGIPTRREAPAPHRASAPGRRTPASAAPAGVSRRASRTAPTEETKEEAQTGRASRRTSRRSADSTQETEVF